MKKDKTLYLTPEVKILVVRVEGAILQASLNGGGGNVFNNPNADVEDGNPGIFW